MLMYNSKDLETAQKKVEMMLQQGNGDQITPDLKKTVKAAQCLDSLGKDTRSHNIKIGIVLSQPIQSYLNSTMSADAATGAHMAMVCSTPVGDLAAPSADQDALMEVAIRKNLAILSGERGVRAAQAHGELGYVCLHGPGGRGGGGRGGITPPSAWRLRWVSHPGQSRSQSRKWMTIWMGRGGRGG